MSSLLQHLRRIALAGPCAGLSDGELLDGFVGRRDGACFEALVRRHGPMVLGVCRRILRDAHDAEDAFQATFLVLVRRASAVPRRAVGNWLYGVAYRTALNARRAAARRRAREKPEEDMPQPTTEPAEDWAELRPLLDEELSRLPEKYRSAVVLCDLEGLTRAEAARHLGVPEGTASGRLTVARRMLAERLIRRGLTLSTGALAALLSQRAATAVPAPLLASTVRVAEALVTGSVAGAVSTQVAALVDRTAKGLAGAKWKPLFLLAASLLGAASVTFSGRMNDRPPIAATGELAPLPVRASPAPRPTDREKLQGKWIAVRAELNGKSVMESGFAGTQFVFAGDRFTYRTRKWTREGTYHLEPTRFPPALDLFLGEDMLLNCIYEVSNTQLKTCWTKGGPRPRGFDAARNPDTLLLILEKQ
jgi:RNA polymerase sigma factor (sigma-70 family)